MKIFLICPVRKMDAQEEVQLREYVAAIEAAGNKIHWPFRDTNQNDPVGNKICVENRQALAAADEVHVYWNTTSTGSLFDLGMAWAFGKPIRLVNLVDPTPSKSFSNFLLWADSQ